MNGKLAAVLEQAALSQSEAARIAGVDKSLISRILKRDYKGWEQKEHEIIETLSKKGVNIQLELIRKFRVDHTTFISTPNVKSFFELASDLMDNPNLTSSIGLVKGTAGRGKTASAKHYISTNRDAAYVLFVDGYTHTMLARQISYELTGIKNRTFEKNVDLIREATRMVRRLVIIDEADKMPTKLLEMLRGLNERCDLPLLLVGEEMLYQRMAEEPRRLSRVRKPIVNFSKVSKIDIALFYEQAIGIMISNRPDVCEELLLRSRGDFRLVVSDAMAICKVLNSSGIGAVTPEVISKI